MIMLVRKLTPAEDRKEAEMPRPKKCRKVCHFPRALAFLPAESTDEKNAIVLTVDEYESLRLIDREGLSQELCGEHMQIARTTVQLIYTAARKKLADALVEGRALLIDGGDYRLCQGDGSFQGCSQCFKRGLLEQYPRPSGADTLRVAVAMEQDTVARHFACAEEFRLYDIRAGKLVACHTVDAGSDDYAVIIGVLGALETDALICGAMGDGARAALDGNSVRLYANVSGDADLAVEHLLAGTLRQGSRVG